MKKALFLSSSNKLPLGFFLWCSGGIGDAVVKFYKSVQPAALFCRKYRVPLIVFIEVGFQVHEPCWKIRRDVVCELAEHDPRVDYFFVPEEDQDRNFGKLLFRDWSAKFLLENKRDALNLFVRAANIRLLLSLLQRHDPIPLLEDFRLARSREISVFVLDASKELNFLRKWKSNFDCMAILPFSNKAKPSLDFYEELLPLLLRYYKLIFLGAREYSFEEEFKKRAELIDLLKRKFSHRILDCTESPSIRMTWAAASISKFRMTEWTCGIPLFSILPRNGIFFIDDHAEPVLLERYLFNKNESFNLYLRLDQDESIILRSILEFVT